MGYSRSEADIMRLLTDVMNSKVVLATVAPTNLKIWSKMRKGYGVLKFAAHFEKMQVKLNSMVMEVNRRITSFFESR